jgi:hypothetical protein
MKRGVVGLLLVLLAIPAMAQRGMAGHISSGAGFRGGFTRRGGLPARPAGAFAGHAGSARFIGHPTGFVIGGRSRRGVVLHHGRFFGGRFSPFGNSFCFRNPVFCGGQFGFSPSFGSVGWGWPWYGYGSYPYGFDYSSYSNYDTQTQAAIAQQQQTIADLEAQLQQERLARMEADAERTASPSTPQQSAVPRQQPAEPAKPTALVFRDGHRIEVVDYAIMGNTLYEFAKHWTRKIALSDLDLPATVRANEENGVEFRVPSTQAKTKTRP